MAESITKDYPATVLHAGNGESELELLHEHGGRINRLVFSRPGEGNVNVVAGLDSLQAIVNDRAYRGVPLYPLANRLEDGRYQHEGKTYQLEINEPALNNALHGFIQHLPCSIQTRQIDDHSSQATVLFQYQGDRPGYPFPAEIVMDYTLNNNSLTMEMTVTNKHSTSVPLGTGWHPYFQLGDLMDQCSLQIPPSKRVLINERMLPTGEVTNSTEFAQLRPIADTQLDTCFQLSDNGTQERTSEVILWSDSSQIGLKLWQESGPGKYNYIQICIAPDRKSIAIEPVSCGINAFNTKQGLTILPPGASWSAKCGVQFITQLDLNP